MFSQILLKVEELRKLFPVKGPLFRIIAWVHAVNGINFELHEGEALGLIGESGCGKTTTLKIIARLIEPTSGKVLYLDKDIFRLKGKELKSFRKEISIIFQDPVLSLNPRMTVFSIVGEPLDIHRVTDKSEKKEIVEKALDLVGLPRQYLSKYPHELSGGEKQRVAIARAIVLRVKEHYPRIVLADEPVSSLDVSVRGSVLNLLKKLKKELNLSFVYVSHDLGTVRFFCDRVGVMYLGKIVEIGRTKEIYSTPLHPYTKALLSAIPIPDPTLKAERIVLKGEVPSPINPPSGCRFHPRCPFRMPKCDKEEPKLTEINDNHFCACHLYS